MDSVVPRFQQVGLEITGSCNLKCPYCPVGNNHRPLGTMPPKVAFGILDSIRDGEISKEIYFHTLGEPLLHKNAYEIFERATQNGLKVSLFTNATLLDEHRLGSLRGLGLNHLHLSMHAHDDRSLAEKFVVPAKLTFDAYIRRAKRILTENMVDGKIAKRLHIRHVVLLDEVWKKRANLFSSNTRNTVLRKKEDMISLMSFYLEGIHDSENDWLEQAKQTIASWNGERTLSIKFRSDIVFKFTVPDSWGNGLNSSKLHKAKFGKCKPIANLDWLSISFDGRVSFCCYDFDFNNEVGKIGVDGSLLQIITGERATNFLEMRRNGRIATERCGVCLGAHSVTASLRTHLTRMVIPADITHFA